MSIFHFYNSLAPFGPFASLSLGLRCRFDGCQLADSKEVVRGSDHESIFLRSINSFKSCFSQSADRLEPAKDFLHPFADSLTDRITRVSCRALVQSRRFSVFDLGDVRNNIFSTQGINEVRRMISLVRPQGFGTHPLSALAQQHGQSRFSLGVMRGLANLKIDTQTVSVFHQRMTRKRKLRFLAKPLTHQPGFGVGRTLVSFVRPFLSSKIRGRIAAPVFGRFTGVRLDFLRLKTFHRSSGIDQSTVHREVVVRQQVPLTGLTDYRIEKLQRNGMREQTFSILGKSGRIERSFFKIHIEKPAEQNVVVQLFTENPIRTYRKQRDQQFRFQQAFRRESRNGPCCCTSSLNVGLFISFNAVSANALIVRSGWFLGTRCSGERYVNIKP